MTYDFSNPSVRYKYEHQTAYGENETEIFITKNQFNHRFRNAHSMFGIFIEEDDMDTMHVVVGPESFTLTRVYSER